MAICQSKLARQEKIIHMERISLEKKIIPPAVLKEIPQEAASYYKIVPLNRTGKLLEVGMVDVEDVNALEALKFIAQRHNLETKLYQISPKDFKSVLKQYRALTLEVGEALESLERELTLEKKVPAELPAKERLERLAEEAPITKVVAVILRHATEGRASDIHIEPTDKDLRVRFRVDGVLHTSLMLPKEIHQAVVSRIKILSNLKIDEQRKPQDGRFRAKIEGQEIDFRVSTLPTANGEKVAMRVLDTSVGLRSLEELGLKDKALEIVKENIKKPFGLILVTGPTGSGKSTTLYAILKILNQEGVNILTLEDPIEYFIEGINQSQIRPGIGYTFATGLRQVVRQDPDVIMVGEIRDSETAELAIHAALTGHIVLSTLHTNNAIGAIPRLIDMGIEPFLITASLSLIIAQRLVRKINKAGQAKEAAPEVVAMFKKELGPGKIKEPLKLPQAIELKDRIGIFEVLSMSPQLEEIIIKGLTEEAIRKEAERQNMRTMNQDGLIKVLEGITTLEEVLKAVEE